MVTGTKSCSDLTVLAPKTSAYTCEVDFTFASLFSHNDTYVDSISVILYCIKSVKIRVSYQCYFFCLLNRIIIKK